MKYLGKLLALVFILLCVPMVAFAQEQGVDPTFYYDLKNTFVAVLVAILVVMLLLGGGLLRVLSTLGTNPMILQAAERGYESARKDTQDLFKTVHTLLELCERLAKEVIPTSELTKQLDMAENILEEVTDSIPSESKTITPQGMTLEEASDILYKEAETGNDPSNG